MGYGQTASWAYESAQLTTSAGIGSSLASPIVSLDSTKSALSELKVGDISGVSFVSSEVVVLAGA